MQNPEFEVEFLNRVFRRTHSRPLASLREDFCGTAAITCAFAATKHARRAVGIDLDAPTLAVARDRHLARLKPAHAARVQLIRADALAPPSQAASAFDAICALNFSYWVFRARDTLVRYFRSAHSALSPGGLFAIDFMGGADCHVLTTDRSRKWLKGFGPFTYVWQHASVDPITASTTCNIHFEFPPFPRTSPRFRAPRPAPMRNAFVYHWRLWSIAELTDALREAGFSTVTTYWEGETATGEGNSVFSPRRQGTPDKSYVGYLIAQR